LYYIQYLKAKVYMAAKPISIELMQQAVNEFYKTNNKVVAAKNLGLAPGTYANRYNQGIAQGLVPNADLQPPQTGITYELSEARAKIRQLESSALAQAKEDFNAEFIKRKIIKLAESEINIPDWVIRKPKGHHVTGIPTLLASDWHWGEVVDPAQVGGVNEYNLKIAQERARAFIETSIDLLKNRFNNPKYEGVVFALGGDMFSGNIHEELATTNDMEVMPCVLDLWGTLVWCIEVLADEFGKVFVPCVSGNHGRNTHKIQNKNRNYTNFDWLLYQFLNKRFENDKRITFFIPDGSDAYYQVYGYKYLLTHGDQFRGGDGVIGCLGAIIRGDHKKRSRNAQIDQEYDTMLIGHFHQLIQLQRLIVNGSLKGYCEYAYTNNFGFEPPRQALWITHPLHGITFSCPVNVDRKSKPINTTWVSWSA
jgi:hypothetical protein